MNRFLLHLHLQLSENFRKTFRKLSENFRKTFKKRDQRKTFRKLSENFRKTFKKRDQSFSREFLKSL